ncbi:cell envelope biogenesis protein OmpA [Microbulbifer sp. SH-1]|uniref:TonB-dependent receptor n=1 Tax=Microbulbifer sp. SH-1 TaxID=2681547 RepID=UPI00140E1430|nr:TonB-dependent receptor [Microbulbifer sp. SH-1]QIL89949.1 cell envelope biogenesis protein OmpA [Microbulbifer sp. SH-1]
MLAAAVSATLCAPVFAADDTKGYLRGALIASEVSTSDVTITVTDQKQGASRTFVTGTDGEFRFPALATGVYDISASKNGEVIAEAKGVVVGLGGKTTFNLVASGSGTIEELEVVGKQVSVDTSSAVQDFVINTDELTSKIPVARNLTSIALLAPSATAGDVSFATNNHDAPGLSLGGASVAENACFINGLNTTDFRKGLSCSQVPFQFLDTVQVKNGGYNAEFGRAIGGVMNATSKRGGNEFESGVNMFWEPDALRSDSPNTYAADNDQDEREQLNFDVWASGAIIQDKLFYYGLYSRHNQTNVDAGSGRYFESTWEDDFWALKIDYVIAEGHTLEYTGFDDTREETEGGYKYSSEDGKGDKIADSFYTRGGVNHTIKYTGALTDDLTLNAQYGINKYDRMDDNSASANPAVIDYRSGSRVDIGNWVSQQILGANDERKAWRIDLDYYVGNHSLRAGFDSEVNTANEATEYTGGHTYMYRVASASSSLVTAGLLNEGDEFVEDRIYENFGSFETVTNAFYIQDEWEINSQLTAYIGVRNESFDNKNAEGNSFIKIDDQWAPRLGITFDPTGDATSKIYGNFGRYFLPIAANTNMRMAGAEWYTADYYPLLELNGDDSPVYGDHLARSVFANGEVADTRSILDENIEPMYQDEFILGYELALNDDWTLGVRGVYRDLKSTIEDIAIDAAVIDHYNSTGTWDASKVDGDTVEDVFGGFHQYVLTNPGADMRVYIPEQDETIELTAGQLGYPAAERTYKALELTFDRAWDGKWMLGGSLVIASLKGNHEGYVKSDNGQDDAGITTSFDQPGLTQGSFGYLPNDRRWTIKTWGSYQFDNGLLMGANLTAKDGRPISCIGNHPTDAFAAEYGSESMFCGGEMVVRGTAGRTSDIFNIDASLQYPINMSNGSELVLRADVFNLFNFDNEIEVRELGELDFAGADPNYKKPTSYQAPRSVRLSANYRF